MEKDANVDVLIRIRGQMELEIQGIRDVLAGKNKALQSLNDTIDLLRGWHSEEAVQAIERRSYNDTDIKNGIEEFFLENANASGHTIRAICDFLEGKGIIPTYCPAVRSKVNRVINELVQDIRCVGNGTHAKYCWRVKQ